MTITNPSPTRAPFDQERVRSKAVLSVDWTRGVATAITGQGATVTRAGNAFVAAGNGVLTPIGTNRPRLLHFVGANRGLLTEGARTNIALHNRDLTQAAWVKTNVTAARDALGVDGLANGASRLTATAGNATCLQTVTLGSSARFMSVWIRRVTGTGVIEMTTNNGTNWDPVTFTGQYARVSIPTRTVTNPVFGFRIVTSGDVIVVDFVQNENGTFATSEIAVGATAVTRPTDQVSYANFPQPAEIAARGGITVYWAGVDLGTREGLNTWLWQVGQSNALVRVLEVRTNPVGSYRAGVGSNTVARTATATAPATGTFGEVLVNVDYRLNAGNPEFRVRIATYQAGVLIQQSAYSDWLIATANVANGWNTTPTLFVGSRDGGNDPGFALNQAFKARFGIHDLASMRTLV
jgi:hypothetical protein